MCGGIRGSTAKKGDGIIPFMCRVQNGFWTKHPERLLRPLALCFEWCAGSRAVPEYTVVSACTPRARNDLGSFCSPLRSSGIPPLPTLDAKSNCNNRATYRTCQQDQAPKVCCTFSSHHRLCVIRTIRSTDAKDDEKRGVRMNLHCCLWGRSADVSNEGGSGGQRSC